jgi:hypothetical protein
MHQKGHSHMPGTSASVATAFNVASWLVDVLDRTRALADARRDGVSPRELEQLEQMLAWSGKHLAEAFSDWKHEEAWRAAG